MVPISATEALKRLQSDDALQRWHAVNELGDRAHPDTFTTLLHYSLNERERHAAWRSLWALTRFPRQQTIPALMVELQNKDSYCRWRAALALSMLDQAEAVPLLREGLESDEEWTQWEALGGLQALHPPGIEQEIAQFLEHSTARHLRQRAILVLGAIGTQAARKLLRKGFEDPHPGVRWRTSMAVRQAGGHQALDILLHQQQSESDTLVLDQLNKDIRKLRVQHEKIDR